MTRECGCLTGLIANVGEMLALPENCRLPRERIAIPPHFVRMSAHGIQAFYDGFFAVLAAAEIPGVILGGQAMLRYRLAETTKAADLFVRSNSFRLFLE